MCKVFSLIKKNKSPGVDKLLNKYFIEACDILAEHLTELIIKILNSGFFPVAWTKGIIVPIHKRKTSQMVKNYRGITFFK